MTPEQLYPLYVKYTEAQRKLALEGETNPRNIELINEELETQSEREFSHMWARLSRQERTEYGRRLQLGFEASMTEGAKLAKERSAGIMEEVQQRLDSGETPDSIRSSLRKRSGGSRGI